jgi:DNA recombination protein Rad52
MPFTDAQIRQLKAKLDPKHIRTRESGGATLHYIEGWHAIAEANRIFGFDGWDRETVSGTCVWSGRSGTDHAAVYAAKVRISVRAGANLIVREGSGTGEANGRSPGQAHELALKAAETDATKRALATFGNSFGLALYDRDRSRVKKPSRRRSAPSEGAPWVLRSSNGELGSTHETPREFAEALMRALEGSKSIEELSALWAENAGTVRSLHRLYRRHPETGVDGLPLVGHLRTCARRLTNGAPPTASESALSGQDPQPSPSLPARIDKSVLTISEPKRIRSKEHLRFVAQRPCLVCGRTPSHAHHVRYAQPRGLSLKVSDEFTVPLCAIHHSENHATGDERRWWDERKIDPLTCAKELWEHGLRKESQFG